MLSELYRQSIEFVVTYKHTYIEGCAMPVITFSSRDFTRDVSAAKRAAAEGPVFITDRGSPAFALLSIEDYYRITGKKEKSLLDVMDSIDSGDDIEFEPAKLDMQFKPADFA
jgi:prevent-host-death family protein